MGMGWRDRRTGQPLPHRFMRLQDWADEQGMRPLWSAEGTSGALVHVYADERFGPDAVVLFHEQPDGEWTVHFPSRIRYGRRQDKPDPAAD